MQFQSVIEDLSNSRLDDKEISRRIVDGFLYIIDSDIDKYKLIKLLYKSKDFLLKTRSDAFINNILNYLLYDIESFQNIKDEISKRCSDIEKHFDLVDEKIINEGCKKIKNRSKLFVLGYSRLILKILKKAKSEGKDFIINNIELRPDGMIMADNISKIGIHVNHYNDSAIEYALEGCDLVFVNGFVGNGNLISNIGIKNLIKICEKREISVFACVDSWRIGKKADKKEEFMKKSNLKVINPKFEEVDLDKLFIISELGVYNGNIYLKQIKSNYPWIISSY